LKGSMEAQIKIQSLKDQNNVLSQQLSMMAKQIRDTTTDKQEKERLIDQVTAEVFRKTQENRQKILELEKQLHDEMKYSGL